MVLKELISKGPPPQTGGTKEAAAHKGRGEGGGRGGGRERN